MTDLGVIKQKLAQIAAYEQYEANWSNIPYRMREPIAPAALAAIESQHEVRLPEDYREFLLEIGNGGAGPGYGLYSLEQAIEERGECLYALSDPFVAPRDHRENVSVRAPGLLFLEHHGCAFYAALAVSGPERGTVWSYVEVAPGWIPECTPGYTDASGEPFQRRGDDSADYYALYDALLLEANRPRRVSFLQHYESWLDGVIRAAAH